MEFFGIINTIITYKKCIMLLYIYSKGERERVKGVERERDVQRQRARERCVGPGGYHRERIEGLNNVT